MGYTQHIRNIVMGNPAEGGVRDLSSGDAHEMFSAALDGGIAELELGSMLTALAIKGETLAEFSGCHEAVAERTYRLTPPKAGGVRPVILPSYGGSNSQANLTPLLALLLQRFHIPVLVHGLLESLGQIGSAYIFRELGVMPCGTLAQAQRALDQEQLAFVPSALLAPGLSTLLALRSRLGVNNTAHDLVRLLDPFGGNSLLLVGLPTQESRTHLPRQQVMRDFLKNNAGHALLLDGSDGEPFANPMRRPRIEYFCGGEEHLLFDAELAGKNACALPNGAGAKATAVWIKRVLDGLIPLPLPLVNQLACCLFAAGYVADFNQAKAIVAVETGSLAAA
jgi:anthranilate phosphoribosyltransferase